MVRRAQSPTQDQPGASGADREVGSRPLRPSAELIRGDRTHTSVMLSVLLGCAEEASAGITPTAFRWAHASWDNVSRSIPSTAPGRGVYGVGRNSLDTQGTQVPREVES